MGLDLEQSALVLAVGEALLSRGSWAGETHIQKTSYFAQKLLNLPLRCRFILYRHGPFSFDLRDLLACMESENLIKWAPQPYPYGPSMTLCPIGQDLLAAAETPKNYAAQIDYLSRRLSSKRVVELERLATALYVSVECDVERISRAKEIVSLKPHIKLSEAKSAILEIDEMENDVRQRGLVV